MAVRVKPEDRKFPIQVCVRSSTLTVLDRRADESGLSRAAYIESLVLKAESERAPGTETRKPQ